MALARNQIRIFILLSFSFPIWGFSQSETDWASMKPQDLEQAILKINLKPLNGKTDQDRISAAFQIQDALFEGLTNTQSFSYPFDSLKYSTIAIASHKDAPVRLFSFNAILSTGKFMHFGVLQFKDKKKNKTFMLTDTSEVISKDYEEEVFGVSQWLGALYYQMLPQKIKGKWYYLLMGFDGHNASCNRSILDVLYFDAGEPLFGAPLFRENEGDPTPANRVIFEYHKSAKMVLKYEPNEKIIVVDHLDAAYEKVKGNKAYYIPTGDYDGYSFTGKTWVKKELGEMNFGQDPKMIDKANLPKPEVSSETEITEQNLPKSEKKESTKSEKKSNEKPSKKEKKKKSDEDSDEDDDDEKD